MVIDSSQKSFLNNKSNNVREYIHTLSWFYSRMYDFKITRQAPPKFFFWPSNICKKKKLGGPGPWADTLESLPSYIIHS